MKAMGINSEDNKQEQTDQNTNEEVKEEIEDSKLEEMQTTRKIKNVRSLVKELQNVIIQRYEDKPLLYKGKKFDLRVYMIIICTKPYFVVYNEGYCRISLHEYNLEDFNTKEGKITHMTNASVQKKHPDYKEKKEDTIIDMNTLKEYLIDQKKIENTQEFDDKVTNKIKEIMRVMFLQVKDKLDRTYGCFELLGWDFLLDENLNPFLIEVNINPALFTDTSIQKKIIPKMINDTIDLVMKMNKHTFSKLPEQEFQQVAAEVANSEEDSKYDFEVIYQEGVESSPLV